MPILVPLLALALVACADPAPAEAPPPPSATMPDTSRTLFSFDGDGPTWRVENDGVMGGRSQGFVEVADGAMRFTGEVVTQGGGFTSARARQALDLTGFDGLELRVRGGGRTFEVDVSDGTRSRGREVNRQGPFDTADEWQTVRVPFTALEATAHGEPVTVDPLDLSGVESIGVYIADGIDGPFRLEVDWIRAYAADA